MITNRDVKEILGYLKRLAAASESRVYSADKIDKAAEMTDRLTTFKEEYK